MMARSRTKAKYLAGPASRRSKPGKKDADILWRYDMMDELGVFPHNASNCSVITLGDTLFACTSNGQDWTHVNIPSPLSPSFIALDKKTGEFLGEDDAEIGPRIMHGQWTSPSIGKVNGKKQVYFGGGDGVLYAFDPTPVKEGDVELHQEGLVVRRRARGVQEGQGRQADQISRRGRPERDQLDARLLQEPRLCRRSARIPSTAKASAGSSASMRPRPATSPRPD